MQNKLIKFSKQAELRSHEEICNYVAPLIKKYDECIGILLLTKSLKPTGFYMFKSAKAGELEYSKLSTLELFQVAQNLKSEVKFSRIVIVRKCCNEEDVFGASKEDFFINHLHQELAAVFKMDICEIVFNFDTTKSLGFLEKFNLVDELEKIAKASKKKSKALLRPPS